MKTKHIGSCHCGAVKFEADMEAAAGTRCNCRICTKISGTGVIIQPSSFRLLQGQDALTMYGNPYARRYFCKVCGIHCYGDGDIPELGGAFVSIALNTLDDIDLGQVRITYWDGRHDNWQAGTRDTPWPVQAAAISSALA